MELKVVIKRRKPGAPSEAEARRQRLAQNLTQEERYIEEMIDARESGNNPYYVSGSPQVAHWYAKQLGMMIWIDGQTSEFSTGKTSEFSTGKTSEFSTGKTSDVGKASEGQIQHQVGKAQHGFFQLYSLEQMEFRLQQIMKTLRLDRLFICQANQPPSSGITYMRGLGTKTTVTSVSWTFNRAGKLIPQVLIQPTRIGNKIFSRVMGHNARFIIENGLGPGAQVRICQVANIQPIIDAVLASEEPALPKPGTWTLNGHHAEPVAARLKVARIKPSDAGRGAKCSPALSL
jgi:hypothetical protein